MSIQVQNHTTTGSSQFIDVLLDILDTPDPEVCQSETDKDKQEKTACEYKICGNRTELIYEFYPKIIVEHPTTERKYYIVKSDSIDEWIHIVNIYSLKKTPTVHTLLKIIKKYVSKTNGVMTYEDIERLIRRNRENINETVINEYINTLKNIKTKNIALSLDSYNNVDTWNIVFTNFTNVNMQNATVNAIIKFNQATYPICSPVISSITPPMARNLNQQIMNIKMLAQNNWKPTTCMQSVLTKIYDIINEHGKIETVKYYDAQTYALVASLITLVGVDSNSIDIDGTQQSTVQQKKNIHSGIGYDDCGVTQRWAVTNYLNERSDRNSNVICIMMDIVDRLIEKSDVIYNYLVHSEFVDCVIVLLNEMTPIDIVENTSVYHSIYSALEKIPSMYLKNAIDVHYNGMTLTQCVNRNYEIAVNPKLTSRVKDKIVNFKRMIDEAHEAQTIIQQPKVTETYVDVMSPHRFGDASITTNYYYANELKAITLCKKAVTRLAAEYTTLQIDLPISNDASIFVKVDPSNMSVMRAMIIGPKDTPYENGCFIFDILIPSNYPTEHPYAQFMNHGGVRFNPNLYANGKVCLSLLGTWGNGAKDDSENWNPAISTIFQLLMSIQSQILVEEPWYNEPGRDTYRLTDGRKEERSEYNKTIQLYTLQHAILNLINKCDTTYPEFAEVIKTHFRLKRSEIHEKYANSGSVDVVKFYSSHKHIIDALQ